MYTPAHFSETDGARIAAHVAVHPLAAIVHQGADGLTADHIPLIYDPVAGTLRGHVARGNPIWRQADGADVLTIFRGAEAYVHPGWYPSKAEHGKVVPTWNYAVVEMRGRFRAVDTPEAARAIVTELTRVHEAGRVDPWAVSDAPEDYIAKNLKAIVAIEIAVSAVQAKWKVSQNKADIDREGVAAGMAAECPAMAQLVEGT